MRQGSYIPKWMKRQIWIDQDGKCFYCHRKCQMSDGRPLTNAEQPDDLFTMDHIVPLSEGGQSVLNNLIGACKACNWEKGNDGFKDFVERKIAQRRRAQEVINRQEAAVAA
jgi:5-methylcytosine-specific restriction endonuclease McrA